MIFISLYLFTLCMEKVHVPVLPKVGEETAIGHEWHDNEGGGSPIKTHPKQGEDIGVV